jgi:hypothetical protein
MGLSIIRSALLLTGLPRPMWSVEWLPLRVQHLLFPFGGLPKTKAELQLLATALGLPDCGTLVELKARCREALGPTPHRLSQLTAPATAGGGGPRQSTVARTVCKQSCTVGGDELVDPELAAWALEVGAIQCPRCAVFVTKNNLSQQNTQRAECHKMLCRCGHKFCFKCNKDLSAGICSCTSHKHGFVDPETKQLVVDEVADAANATKETQSQTSGKKRLRQSNLHDVLDPKKTKTSSASGSG